ncbi:auxin-responsive protein IAA27 isoform X2 [Mercurialis annua]|uniref:auxin-responsive protein IAA27 isoform X2 n=1 Tax=Mercurialis annua TaxID=3986 RepID=UPI0021605CC1|nr:auxin-responsive protein IAA27 isoform X2 [Mercurialis annua]
MAKNTDTGLNLKATELRLGLPGSESPERDKNSNGNSVTDNSNSSKSFVSSGAKRGFSVAIHGGSGSGNWVFSATNGSDPAFSAVNGLDSVQSPKPVTQVQIQEKKNQTTPASKAQVVGWPPIRSFRKNTMAAQPPKNDDDEAEAKLISGCLYIKVSMDGAPYLRKVDLRTYNSYTELSSGLEKMFSCFTIGQCDTHGVPSRDGLSESRLMDLLHGSEYVLTYEDKDDDWMLVGDVPWKMFTETCRRLRIMKSSEAIGLAPRAMEKCKSRN